MTQGRLVGLATRERSRAPMMEMDEALVTVDRGVASDFRGKSGARQVTVLAAEAWNAACVEVGRPLPWTTRRANLLVEGVELAHAEGAVLRIGDVRLHITGELDPCARMDESCAGLQNALVPDWRGGVCCRVIVGGKIEKGAPVTLEPAPQLVDH